MGSWLLLPCRDRLFHAGNLNPTESLGITRNTAIERFRDALAVFRCAQLALVGWITDERDLRQDRGHVGADQHDKGRFLYSTILYPWTLRRLAGMKRLLYIRGKLARLIDLVLQRNLFHEVLQLVYRRLRNRVLAG